MNGLCPPVDPTSLTKIASARILYADTDQMGIVYHAAYLRYLELARVELIRSVGMPYTQLEAAGLALPLTDIALGYHSPGLYDDVISIHIGVAKVTRVRVFFDYHIRVHPGDRAPLAGRANRVDEDIHLLTAHTRHACVRREGGRPERLPRAVYEVLSSCYKPKHGIASP